MCAWVLALYVAGWHVVAGLRLPFDADDINLLETSNIEMLVPLVFSNQGAPRGEQQRHLPAELSDEPFSWIPGEAFVLDEPPQLVGELSGSSGKDLSGDVMPISVHLHELQDIDNRARDDAAIEIATDPDASETQLLDASNIELLIPLIFGKHIETPRAKHQRHLPSESFSWFPREVFVRDDKSRVRGGSSRSIKKDLSRDSMPISIYTNHPTDINNRLRGEAANEETSAENLASEVMLYLCSELLDSSSHHNHAENTMNAALSKCQECCSHLYSAIQAGRVPGEGVAASENGSMGLGSLSLFGPVGGRRDWSVLHEKYPGM